MDLEERSEMAQVAINKLDFLILFHWMSS